MMHFIKIIFIISSLFNIYITNAMRQVGEAAEFTQQRLGGRNAPKSKPWTIEPSLEYFKAHEAELMTFELDVLYSFNERFAIEVFTPFILKNKFGPFVSRGIGDMIIDFQWVPWKNDIHTFLIIPGIKFPTGNPHKEPLTGTGTYDFSFEFASYHASDRWHVSFVYEMLLTSKRKGYKFGNEYNYEFIFGRQINYNDDTRLVISAELFGIYLQKDRFFSETVPDTGGHTLYLGPLFSFQYKDILIDLSHMGVISEHLFGVQPKNEYTTLLACTFFF